MAVGAPPNVNQRLPSGTGVVNLAAYRARASRPASEAGDTRWLFLKVSAAKQRIEALQALADEVLGEVSDMRVGVARRPARPARIAALSAFVEELTARQRRAEVELAALEPHLIEALQRGGRLWE